MNSLHSLSKKHQGISLLVLVITLLLVSTLLILLAAQYSVLQQKISSNLYRNQQAFEAAQAGIEAATPYFQDNSSAITAGASGGYLTPYINSSTRNVALANGSKYSFVYSNPVANNFQLITITSTGKNADGTSIRTLTQQIQMYGSSISTPTVTSTAQGSISLANRSSINNSFTNLNIDAGTTVSLAGRSQTTTSSGISSNSSKTGSDITQNNTSLSGMSSSDFFMSIFGTSETTVQNAANYTYNYMVNHTYNTELNGVTGSIIWINQNGGTATINSTTTVGSLVKPVVLIVNGNLSLSNTATIYGLVFILAPSSTVIIGGSAIINGAIITTGNLSFQSSGTLNYNSSVLSALPTISGGGSYAKVPGSWRDF